ncbi:MAG: hypothetical protein JNL47_08385 [Bacteroidia bacterium]|nr:hypothetical protein [Bacteroidia bacterium]
MKKIISSLLLLLMISLTVSCKKEKDPELPEVSFKEGMGYVSSNTTVGKSNQITIGVTAKKNKATLKTFTVYQAYDNFEYQQVYIYTLLSNEGENFSRDYQFTTRTESGREKYKFTVTDADGNTGIKEIILQVQ